jgi:hypothetical protein
MAGRIRHSREGGNPLARFVDVAMHWIPAFAGMTKNLTH